MMKNIPQHIEPPDVLPILGSDASEKKKKHVANVAAEMMQRAGHPVEKKKGRFSQKTSRAAL